jgi:hypothetical protein
MKKRRAREPTVFHQSPKLVLRTLNLLRGHTAAPNLLLLLTLGFTIENL